MNRAVWAGVCLAAIGCGRFEGEVQVDETNTSGTTHHVYEAKGGRIRASEDGKTDYTIFDGSRTYAIDNAAREILVIDVYGRAGNNENNRISKTAATETVAGHACTVWNVELYDGEKGEVCIASDLKVGGQRADMWFPRVKESGFPLRGVLHDKDGKLIRELWVTSIQAKAIDSSRLDLPKGYKRVEWDDLRRGLGR